MNAQKVQHAAAGKYLTFQLGSESYGVQILKVHEIIRLMHITPVPSTPRFVRGVINLRGKIVPVVDPRARFGMPQHDTEESCIIVVSTRGIETGIVVDKVCDVLDVESENIGETPDFGSNVDTDYLLGIGKSESDVTLLLDIDKVLAVVALEPMLQDGEQADRSAAQQ